MPEIVCRVIDCHVFAKRGKSPVYLLLQRSPDVIYGGSWRMVGGKIEAGEKAWETALRELKEETGLAALQLWAVPFVNQFYEPEKDRINSIPVFAARVEERDPVLSAEHGSFKWCSIDEAIELLPWPAQQEGLRITHDHIAGLKEVSRFMEIPIIS